MTLDSLCRWWRNRSARHGPRQKGCLGCGTCCEVFGGYLHASEADIARWQRLGRQDLLEWVGPYGWIWVDPGDGRRGTPCPFLCRTGPTSAHCGIHDVKPDICREYPTVDHHRQCVLGLFIPPTPSPTKTASLS